MAIEGPKYQVERTYPSFEVRRYASYLVAETEVVGSREQAGNEGFRRLAGYIFGKNRGAKKIAMTSPVAEAEAKGAKIAMTAPVVEVPAGGGDRFVIQFMMPSEYTRESLPQPIDDRIHFPQVPERRIAAIRYSGTWSERRYQKHLQKLRAAMAEQALAPAAEPVWARYDPPFKPWFLRRNEILIEVGE